jgi:acyl-coenzyme A synthetase/AMP-(fatty) acid ligase
VAPAELEVRPHFISVVLYLTVSAKALLLTHPKVKDTAVIGVYDESQATELPRAYVVVNDPKDAASPNTFERELQEFVASKVRAFLGLSRPYG